METATHLDAVIAAGLVAYVPRLDNRDDSDYVTNAMFIHRGEYDLDQVQLVHDLHNRYTIWVADTKFAQVRDAQPTAFKLDVRDAKTKASILTTSIDNNSQTLQYMQDEMTAHQTALKSGPNEYMQKPYLSRFTLVRPQVT